MMNTEEILKKIAIDICNHKCGLGDCPCHYGCEAYGDEECIDRIMNYFKSIISK